MEYLQNVLYLKYVLFWQVKTYPNAISWPNEIWWDFDILSVPDSLYFPTSSTAGFSIALTSCNYTYINKSFQERKSTTKILPNLPMSPFHPFWCQYFLTNVIDQFRWKKWQFHWHNVSSSLNKKYHSTLLKDMFTFTSHFA